MEYKLFLVLKYSICIQMSLTIFECRMCYEYSFWALGVYTRVYSVLRNRNRESHGNRWNPPKRVLDD